MGGELVDPLVLGSRAETRESPEKFGLETLDGLKVAENTLVIITGGSGPMLNQGDRMRGIRGVG